MKTNKRLTNKYIDYESKELKKKRFPFICK